MYAYRLKCSAFTDKHLFVAAFVRTILSSTYNKTLKNIVFFINFQYFDTLTSDPSNSNRALIFGCITIQTLFLVRQFVKITSQVRPARVELLTEVKNSYIIINHE